MRLSEIELLICYCGTPSATKKFESVAVQLFSRSLTIIDNESAVKKLKTENMKGFRSETGRPHSSLQSRKNEDFGFRRYD